MTDELIARLRDWIATEQAPEGRTAPDAVFDMREAADRIEELEARAAGLTQERDFQRETADLHADRIEALEQRVRELERCFRDVADAVCVWAIQPPHPLRQRDPINQAQWDQIAEVVKDAARKALGEQP